MSKLDYQAALALLSDGKEQPVETMSEFEAWLKGQTTMFVLRRNEHSGRFCFNFARPGLRGFIHRMTGGCGNMKPEYWEGMNILMDALSGHSDDGSFQPKMSGLTLFGGTRMLYKRDPKIVRPGITEVFPGIAADCPEAVVLGIVARYSKMYPTNHGLVIGTSPEDDYFTIVHPNQKSIAVLQDNADEISPWEAEYLRCSDVVGELQEQGWQSLLTAYNGGGVTKKEVLHWCKLSQMAGDPTMWRVLLIEGSGGSTDALIQDKDWLRENPNVSVCGCSVKELRDSFFNLGAITFPKN